LLNVKDEYYHLIMTSIDVSRIFSNIKVDV
jgi:hypothetical protein